MGISRRSVLVSAALGSGLAVAGVVRALPSQAASAPGDVVGKIPVGYQGWFACIGDGAPINAWWHWSANSGQPPSPSNNIIRCWPDVRDFTRTYATGFQNLSGGRPAALFSSFDQQTV